MPNLLPPHIQWACPKCHGHNLSVMVTASAKLVQSEDNFETEDTGSHEWDGDSLMNCDDCHDSGTASSFKTAGQGETP